MSQSTIISSPLDLNGGNIFIKLNKMFTQDVYVKVEGYNAAGSIKMKPAINMIKQAIKSGTLKPDGEVVESSSGNLGVALSIVCAHLGYQFTCITDPVCSEVNKNLIKAYGAKIIVVDKRDSNGGYLQTRIQLIHTMLKNDSKLVWLNQYANESNYNAHTLSTAPEILRSFPRIDWLFIGAGTTGTLMGCIKYFSQYSPHTKIIAVDSIGSVTFGGPPSKRNIPGLGTSRIPEILDRLKIKKVVMVPERDTVDMCNNLSKSGYLFGGSTGTVLAGVIQMQGQFQENDVVVTLSPDFGERYLDTIYDADWRNINFGVCTKLREQLEIENVS